MTQFQRYIGVDYSGAAAPHKPINGLRVFTAEQDGVPQEQRGKWSRDSLCRWLIEELKHQNKRTIVAIDHGFSLPQAILDNLGLSSWQALLDFSIESWRTHEVAVSLANISYSEHFLRLTEKWTSSARSTLTMHGQGMVGKSTHAGIPQLQRLRKEVGRCTHFWPFDGWKIERPHAVVEGYPALFHRRYEGQTGGSKDARDAYALCRWLWETDGWDKLDRYLDPPLTSEERGTAELEGWILGVA